MAAYNYGQYIGEAVRSVTHQTFANWELIIVDDGSMDDTRNVVRAFLSDRRIHYHWQRNRGQPQAKNTGIRLSKGGLIAFLDADDIWLPEKLAKQVTLFDTDPELGVAYTGRYFIDPQGRVRGPERRAMIRGFVLDVAIKRTIPPFSSTIIRRAVLDDVGYFDESIPMAIDYDLWLRVAMKYRFDFVDEPLLLYRTGHANLSRRSTERRTIVLRRILPRFLAMDGVRGRLGWRPIAEAYADTYMNHARELRAIAFFGSLAWHSKAILRAPWMAEAWWSAIRCCVPDRVVSCLKAVARSGRRAWLRASRHA